MKKYFPIFTILFCSTIHAATPSDYLELEHHLFQSIKNDLLQIRSKIKAPHLKERYLTEKEFNEQEAITMHLNEKLLVPWSLINEGTPCINISENNIIQAGDIIATSKGLSFSFIPISPGTAILTMCYGIEKSKYKKFVINIKY